MAMERWDPFRDMMTLRDAMERLIQDSVVRPASALMPGMRGNVPMDVVEEEDRFVVRASLPGIKPEDVRVTVQGDILTIRGQTSAAEEQRRQNWVMRERRSGSVYRTITLPAAVDADKAQASFEHGILNLMLPKAELAKPHHIPIGQGQQAGAQTSASAATSATSATSASASRQDRAAGNGGNGRRQDQVTQASEESFPASDAPSWTPERS